MESLPARIDAGRQEKAARRLNISQPAVSKAIAELERALGVRLVDRSRRGIMPTPFGLALKKRSVAIFNDLRQSVQDIDFLSDPTTGELPIGTTDPLALAIASPRMEPASFCGGFGARAFRAGETRPPPAPLATLSEYMKDDLLATGRFLTVLPSFMLKIPGRYPPLRALPVALPNPRMPIGIVTLKDRMLSPLAQLFIDNIRAIAKPMAQSQ